MKKHLLSLVKWIVAVIIVLSMLFVQAGLVGPQSVHARVPDSGAISGILYDAANHPITGVAVQVRAVLKSDGSEVASTTSNSADGSYSLTGLPLNTGLAVVASDESPDIDGYLGEYYDNVEALEWAETITLTDSAPDRDGVDSILDTVDTRAGATIEHLTFNTRPGRLLNDVDIRRAIAFGTNRSSLLYDAFLHNELLGVIMHSMISPGLGYQAARSDLTIYPYNLTTAQDILTNAGWMDTDADGIRENGNGDELELSFKTVDQPFRVESAALFTLQMQAIGIRIFTSTYPNISSLFEELDTEDFDIAEFAWILFGTDILPAMYNSGDTQNYGGYSNAAVDDYYNEARNAKIAGDQTAFLTNALLWQQTVADELPVLPLFTRRSIAPAQVIIGSNVIVYAGNAVATFEVSSGGWFGSVPSKYNPDDLPAGYAQGDPNVYEVGVSTGLGGARVCITYDSGGLSIADEYSLRMFHLENLTTWTDVTAPGTLDVDANQICGDFTGFSVVALMVDPDASGSISGTVKDANGSPITGIEITVSAERADKTGLGWVNTNPADGSYLLEGLPFGVNFTLIASDNSGAYGLEYYNEAAMRSQATIFNLSEGTPSYTNVVFTLPPAKPAPGIEHLTFNVRPERILSDPVIRKAIAYATDRERILNNAFLANSDEYGMVMNTFVPPGYWSQPAYDQVTVYPYNFAEANAILNAAGFTDHNGNGIRDIPTISGYRDIVLEFKTTPAVQRVAAAAIFAADMTAIGIQINVVIVPAGEFFGTPGPLTTGDFDIAEFAWTFADLNLDDIFPEYMYQTGNIWNYGDYSNATVDAEYDAAMAATNRTDMLPHVLAYYAETTDDLPSLPLFTREDVTPIETSSGANVLADLSGVGVTVRFQNAALGGRTAAYVSAIHPADLPANNTLVAVYEIGSSVSMSPGTGATICVDYDDSGLTSAEEGRLQLYHLTMTGIRAWANIFTSRDTIANHVCGFTNSFSAFAVLLPPLSAPTDVWASDGASVSIVRVIWTASSGATSYQVYRADSASGAKTLLGSPAVASYDDTTAVPLVTYFYWVKACDGGKCSDFSAYDTGWRSLSVAASDGTFTDKVQVAWNPSSGATSYKVYRATSASGTKSLLGGPAASPYNDITASPGVTYTYWVKACRGAVCSDFSFSDTGWRKPLAPTGLTASDGTYTDKVALSWTGSAGATSYQVYRATSAMGTKAGPATTAATTTNDTTATPGITYWYFVKACRGANCSDFSAYDTGWRNIAPPTNLRASDGTFPDKVRITWTASLGATSYKLYRAVSATDAKTLLGSTAGTTANDTLAAPGVTYYYWVQACRGAVCSDFSAYDTGYKRASAAIQFTLPDIALLMRQALEWIQT